MPNLKKMNYLILNSVTMDIGISNKPYPISMSECLYVWKSATLENSGNDFGIKNSDGLIVAYYPKQTTVTFCDLEQLKIT